MTVYLGQPNGWGCYEPRCQDSTWDHACPVLLPFLDGEQDKIVAFLRASNEHLVIFNPKDPTENKHGPYQELSPELLALPKGDVIWLAEHPALGIIVEVPGRFMSALLDGDLSEVVVILGNAVRS